jgi:23S rRNA pseudouridine1911/1915/1917 synthase
MPNSYRVEQPLELLEFLFLRCQDVKKTKLRNWLKHGQVLVNGEAITRHDHPLSPGDIVSIDTSDQSRAEGVLPKGLGIVFEDDSLLVIEKPANLLSIATEGQKEKTAHAHLMRYINGGHPRGKKRIWIVHRLDRETSGLMVFAKTESAKETLQSQWSQTEKRYLAIVEGRPPEEEGELRSHLDESRAYKVHAAKESSRTRLAITEYKIIKQTESKSLLELKLKTGRRNQIRVQLAEAGCPVLGDDKYGPAKTPAPRLALHASYLSFPHPVTGELCEFESPLPNPLARLIP